jgi:predicted enzyme related to lactoylglutathione lyase
MVLDSVTALAQGMRPSVAWCTSAVWYDPVEIVVEGEDTMFRVTGLRSWNFNADRFEETTRFYSDQLGMAERSTQTIGGAAVVRLRLGETGLGFFDSSQGPRPNVPHHTFTFEGPEEPEAAVRELEAVGIKVEQVRPHQGGKGYSLYVLDPNGNRIELSHGEG